MAAPSTTTKVLIFATLIIYIFQLAVNALAARGGPGNKLFPRTVSNASDHFHLEITPVGPTFAIWGVIFAYQLAWLIYTVTTVFRSGPACDVLSNRFYLFFNINIISVVAWLLIWVREEAVASFIVITLGQIFLNLSIAVACIDLHDFMERQKQVTNRTKADVWCQRILVQNGLLFYATWGTVATLINFAVFVKYELGAADFTASMISLSFLGALAITWFALESFAFKKYTEYTFTVYIVLIVALTGILLNIWDEDKRVGGLALALLILSALFLIARIIIIAVRSRNSNKFNDGQSFPFTK